MTDLRRNWIVNLDWLDGDSLHFGPYTQAQAARAEARIRRWLAKHDDEWTEGGDWVLGSFPIHQWNANDEED